MLKIKLKENKNETDFKNQSQREKMDIPIGVLVPEKIENGDVEVFGLEIIDDKVVYYMCETTDKFIELNIEGFYCDGDRFDYPDSNNEQLGGQRGGMTD